MLFVTGMVRSGTTLLQHALSCFENCHVDYQSKTSFFIDCAKEFERSLGMEDYHVLKSYSPNPGYTLKDFTDFLDLRYEPKDFFSSDDGQVEKKFLGLKEVLMEAYAPYFVRNGVKTVIIIRDPRDVIASMYNGDGRNYVGERRPLLFDLRNWRKSVLISHILRSSENFLVLKMEDLILRPELSLYNLSNFLGFPNFCFKNLMINLGSSGWKGNSSFGERDFFDTKALGNYKKFLDTAIVKYIETICMKEMSLFGYSPEFMSIDGASEISNYRDDFKFLRDEFCKDFSSKEDNVLYEITRLNLSLEQVMNLEFCSHQDILG